ncbi:MAG: ferrochelatase, partial [Chloroflexi bacterium]
WLGPDLVETIEELAAQGHRSILVASVGFIADHLEIFYDIDIEAKERADALGIELRRTPMLNADPRLAHALHALIAQRTPTLPSPNVSNARLALKRRSRGPTGPASGGGKPSTMARA